MNRPLLVLVLVSTLLSVSPGISSESSVPDYETSWIVVKLKQPLAGKTAEGTYPIVTRHATLNVLIQETGVLTIDNALRISTRDPRSPEALSVHGLDRIYRFHVPEGAEIQELITRFAALPEVEYAEPDYIVRSFAVPIDPWFTQQWQFDQVSDADMDGVEAWDIATGGGTILAIVDSGVDLDHVDLSGKVVAGYDLVDDDGVPDDGYGHGTRVASIASADTNNNEGIAGACWDCSLMPVRVLDSNGLGGQTRVSDGIVWAADNGARIINLSLGYYAAASPTLTSAVSYAADTGAVMITAGGNDNLPQLGVPSELAEAMTTGATDEFDRRSWPMCGDIGFGSNYSEYLDFVAPGEDIAAASMGGGYDLRCGTSFAAPLVTGLAGIMHSINPSVGREEIRHLISAGAEDEVGDPSEDVAGFDVYHGWGRVNMDRTLAATESSVSLRVEGKASTRVYLETANPVATSFDFIRGDLGSLSESSMGVELGTALCLEDDSPDADTFGGNEDIDTPAPGEGYFYLARFGAAPGPGLYGGSSRNRDRVVFSSAWSAESDQDGARLGLAVSSAGDVNDDGHDDVIVGAYLYDNPEMNEGAAFLYLGSPTGLAATPTWSAEGNQESAFFASAVASAGDVNGDGNDDVIVGVSRYDVAGLNEGRVEVYLGTSTGLESVPDWAIDGDQDGARLGSKVGTAGDVNNDGYDDVIVAARFYDAGQTDEGRAYVYLGSAAGLEDAPSWTFETDQALSQVNAVGTAGDVNGDDYDDIIVTGRRYDGGQIDEGRVWIFLGGAAGVSATPAAVLEVDVAGAEFGFSAGTAGDVNGDNLDDVVVGAHLYTEGETGEGAVFLHLGTSGGVTSSPVWSFESDQVEAHLGQAVAGAGDIDNDGFADVVIGAADFDSTRTDEGAAWVFLGSATGLPRDPSWSGFGWQTTGLFGWSVSTAGDVNGDGLDDVIIGAYRHQGGQDQEGRAYLYLGPIISDCP
jgi:hypothetical protein